MASAIAVAVACSLTVAVDLAGACSCMPMDAGARLADGEVAFVGTVTAKQEVGPVGDPPMGNEYDYTVAVERSFNADLPEEITLRGNSIGAACGFSSTVGRRIGAFLYREDGRWTTYSCSLVPPDDLIAAADAPPPPPPLGVPQVVGGTPDSWLRLRTYFGKASVPGVGGLTVRTRGRVTIRVDRPAKAVRVTLAGRHGKPVGNSRRAHRRNDGRRLWAVRMPRRIPARTRRLDVAVTYSDDSSATFVVALTVKRDAARSAACPAR